MGTLEDLLLFAILIISVGMGLIVFWLIKIEKAIRQSTHAFQNYRRRQSLLHRSKEKQEEFKAVKNKKTTGV
ncbi:MAG: hypothetical protein ACOY9Y_11630 [Bacillota bacterium]